MKAEPSLTLTITNLEDTMEPRARPLPLLGLLLAASAQAEDAHPYDLPAQPLSSTLDRLAQASHTKMIYSDEAVRGLDSPTARCMATS